jgi:hypothetical protein
MSTYKKFTLAERAYGKGRRAKFVKDSNVDKDLFELTAGLDLKEDEYNILHSEWYNGYVSATKHNPLPTGFKFEAPPITQKIKFDNQTRGVVLAYMRNGHIWIGWSIRNLLDKFDPEYAVVAARVNSMPLNKFTEDKLPKFHSRKKEVYDYGWKDGEDVLFAETFEDRVRHTVYRVVGRAFHYYQQFNLESLTRENGRVSV